MLFKNQKNKNQTLVKQVTLSVKSEIEALEEILVWFEGIAQPLLPKKCLWECKLALAEGFTNTVLYAHRHLSVLVPIILEINFYVELIEIKIWNLGPEFDLKGKLQELNQTSVDPLEKESDRGLFFMQELTDELDYIRLANRRNCLIMQKYIR